MYIKEIEIQNKHLINMDTYPFSLPVIKNLGKLPFTKPVTFFVGDNGSGKSTLIEAIANGYGFNSEGGSKNFTFSTNDTTSELYNYMKIVKTTALPKDGYFFRAESFYNLATNIDSFGDLDEAYGGRSLHKRSHGEGFLALMTNRLFGNGLYIFDEPESALSIEGQMAMLNIINQLVQKKSQLIIATHSPILISYPNATIYEISGDAIRETNYEDTKNYSLTKYFLSNYKKMIHLVID